MSSRLRVVVVGAGVGGLSAAIDLGASGFDVTLFERAPAPGGKMRELEPGGYAIDSGPTVFTMRWVFERLYARAGTSLGDELTLHPAPTLARHRWLDGSQLDLFSNVDLSAAAIEEFAGPAEANGYRRFAAATEGIFDTLNETFMQREKPGPLALSLAFGLGGLPRLYATRPFRTLWAELGRYFTDPRLRQLFARYATYTGSSPFAAPATLSLIAHVERDGVYYVDGGMQRLAESLASVAARTGAELCFNTGIARIETRNGKVSGVVTDAGEFTAADCVVFNGDVLALSRGELGPGVKRAVPPRRGEQRSLSALTYSLVANVDSFPLDHHTVFFGDDYQAEFDALFKRGEIHARPTVYVCAQDRESVRDVEGVERLFVLVNAPARRLSEQALAAGEAAVRETLEASGLELPLGGPASLRFTPKDFAERFPGTDGAIYGWPTHGMLGSFRRHGSRARIAGLYLAGGSVHPGPGVPMTALSGQIAADAVREDLSG